jgi:hypothetical protein
MKQTFTGAGQTIETLMRTLNELKQSFDSGNIIQTVFVSTRTLKKVEELGLCKTC